MQPAFSSTKQAAAFAALILVILLCPFLLGRPWLRSRDQIYSSIPWGAGPYAYVHDQIYEEKGDIDVAFMGPSTMWYGIDTPYFQKELSEKLGRPAAARTLCWDWVGADAFYRIAKDLLEHRRVRMIVFCDPAINAPDTAHKMASDLFRWPERGEDLDGLQLRAKTAFYAAALVGMPKNLWGRVRPNLPVIDSEEMSWPGYEHMVNPFRRLGALVCHYIEGRSYVEFTPPTHPDASSVCVYSDLTKTNFQFLPVLPTGELPLQRMQVDFLRKVAHLAQSQDVKFVYLYVPRSTERTFTKINSSAYWPDIFGDNISMVGIPPAKLYAGLSDDDILKLYWEYRHFNENGQKYFTTVVTPTLVDLYEKKTKP
jgi:hypothetical protein